MLCVWLRLCFWQFSTVGSELLVSPYGLMTLTWSYILGKAPPPPIRPRAPQRLSDPNKMLRTGGGGASSCSEVSHGCRDVQGFLVNS